MLISRFYGVFATLAIFCSPNDQPTANEGAAPATEVVKDIPIPPGKSEPVPFEKIRRVHNVRSIEAEKFNGNRLLPSMLKSGYIAAYPMMLHDNGHGSYDILAGHGRYAALSTATPEQRKQILAKTGGKVPAIIYKNLSDEEKAAVRGHDFTAASDKLGADKWTEYLIVKDFRKANPKLSDVSLATFMGWLQQQGKNRGQPNINKVKNYRRLHELSIVAPSIDKEFERAWNSQLPESPVKNPFADGDIPKLHALLAQDQTGAAARQKISEAIAKRDSGNVVEAVKVGPHKLSAKDAAAMASATPCVMARRMLLAVTNQPITAGQLPEKPEKVIEDLYAMETAHIVSTTSNPDGNGFDDVATTPEETDAPTPRKVAHNRGKAHSKGKGK